MRTMAIVVLLILMTPRSSRAEQFVRGDQVIHTRLAPVVVHRVLPPYKGIHVYQGRARR